jgi:hypothetical protein
MMIIYDESVDGRFGNRCFRSEVFGDRWDMFRNHHWGLRTYLDPPTINFFRPKKRFKKTQNHRAVIFRYSDVSKKSHLELIYARVDCCSFFFNIL